MCPAFAANTPVILISIDTLRADHLSSYGCQSIRTPNIDSFAEGGTLFANADCQVPLTLPSHTSLFTSTYPFENRIEENAERVPANAVTIASVLRSHGYKTAAFIGSVFLEREMGLDEGFDVYDSPFHFTAFSPISGSMFFGGPTHNADAGRDRRDGALVVRAAEQWLAANQGTPVFLFLHLFDIHKPYVAHSSVSKPGISGYDEAIEYVDSLLGSFQNTLRRDGWWDRSLVILLSDHGEGLDQHGESSHGYFVYESTLHTPLIFHWPDGGRKLGARVDRPAALIGVAPTILDFLHTAAPASFHGASLLLDSDRPVYAESLHTHDAFGWAPLRSLRMGDYKYIEAPHPELYNLARDPHERQNIVLKEPERAERLRAALTRLQARYAPHAPQNAPSQVTPQTRALLGSLGYLSGGIPSKIDVPGPDPKDRLPEFQLYERAMVLVYKGRLVEAIAALNRLLANDPANTLARRDLGACYLEQRSYGKARSTLEQVVKAAPSDYMSQYELGVADEHLGLLNQAREHLEDACQIAPDAAQCRQELRSLGQETGR